MKLYYPILLIFPLFLNACIKSPTLEAASFQAEDKTNAFLIHRVKSKSESLADIATWYTGDKSNSTKISNATPGLDDNKLKIGEIVFIPDNLVIKRDEFKLSKKISKTKSSFTEKPNTIEEFHPNNKGQTNQPAAVIGIYRFDQLPTPKGETPESLQRLFNEGKGGEEAIRAQLRRELLEE